ncbi:MAG: DUF916 domain-containing protein [Frankiales bacterium]|nr:DUF916 domain-containing protein [Frankiales bacterium]
MSRTDARPPFRALAAAVLGGLALALLAPGTAARADTSTPSPAPSTSGGTSASSAAPNPDVATFGVAPASAKGADGKPSFAYGATAGARLSDHAAVLNYGAKPITVRLIAVDAVNTDAGGLSGLDLTKQNTDLGKWVALPRSAAKVTVPPRTAKGPGQTIVPFTVSVPADASPGDHTALLLAVLSANGKDASGANIQLDQRVGTRMFLRVSGVITPQLTVSDVIAEYHGGLNPLAAGTMSVTYTVRNTGNVKLGAVVDTTVAGLLGATAKGPEGSVGILLPGNEVRQTVVVPGVWPQFRESVKVVAHPRLTSTDSAPGLSDASGETSVLAVPWSLLLLLLLVLAGIVGLAVWLVRRRGGGGPPTGRRARTEAPRGRREAAAPRGRREAPANLRTRTRTS